MAREECGRLAEIDRGESIREEYVVRGGVLALEPCHIDAEGWAPGHLVELIGRLRDVVDAGGEVVGAFLDGRVIAMAALDPRPIGGDDDVMELTVLFVDRSHRGRGIGSALVRQVARAAEHRGASTLYISATPTRATVDAYLRMGACLAPVPDPDHLAAEPLDVHLVLALR